MADARDERVTRAIELFQEAWMLLSNLEDLRRRLPQPNLEDARPLPSDWNDLRSYARCVEVLRAYIESGLKLAVQDVDIRNEHHIRSELLPPSAKFGLTGPAWLKGQLDRLNDDDDSRGGD